MTRKPARCFRAGVASGELVYKNPMLNLKPLSDRVLVRVEEEEVATKEGIYIPEVARERQMRAHVVALGTGKPDKNWQFFVEEGQTVLFTRYAGTLVDMGIPDVKFLLLRQDDILGVVNNDVTPEDMPG